MRKFKLVFEVYEIPSDKSVIDRKQVIIELSERDLANAGMTTEVVKAAFLTSLKFIQGELGLESDDLKDAKKILAEAEG